MAARAGMVTASAPLWLHETCVRAFAQSPGTYKAIVVVTLQGGNDGNNLIVPIDNSDYQAYASLRGSVAIPQGALLPLASGGAPSGTFGMHPSLQNTAALYNRGNAVVVANVGPLSAPVTKAQLATSPSLYPQCLLSHPAGIAEWESASTLAFPTTGWGGRMADLLVGQSGSLPPIFDCSAASIFTVGRSVQGIVLENSVESNTPSMQLLPSNMSATILAIAQDDANSTNAIISQAAQLRVLAMNQQALLQQAQSAGGTLATTFPNTAFGFSMQSIANVINGRSVIGVSRQIFYVQQGAYDTHTIQLTTQAEQLSELDGGIGALYEALQEMGLQNDVLICTHSDFNRTYTSNTTQGSDHAWGNQQIIIGGGIRGGRIIGTMPEPEIGGQMDINGYGIWIPTLSVTQMVAGIGAWMGLTQSQLASVFPDLSNFAQGAITLT
jgi:uncharacterized protein (DUF1501 family)